MPARDFIPQQLLSPGDDDFAGGFKKKTKAKYFPRRMCIGRKKNRGRPERKYSHRERKEITEEGKGVARGGGGNESSDLSSPRKKKWYRINREQVFEGPEQTQDGAANKRGEDFHINHWQYCDCHQIKTGEVGGSSMCFERRGRFDKG